MGLVFKLLDGDGRGKLSSYAPEVAEMDPKRKCRHTTTGLQIVDKANSRSLLAYERSKVGRAPAV
jgi:hypothetical protein